MSLIIYTIYTNKPIFRFPYGLRNTHVTLAAPSDRHHLGLILQVLWIQGISRVHVGIHRHGGGIDQAHTVAAVGKGTSVATNGGSPCNKNAKVRWFANGWRISNF